MKKIIAAIIIVLMLLPLSSACSNSGTEAINPATKQPETTTAASPLSTPDPAASEAKQLAAEHGLSEEELRGEYGLFIKFCKAVEGNETLGSFGEFVYRIFPVIADNAEFVDEEHLLYCLRRLSISTEDLGADGSAGEYNHSTDSIVLDTNTMGRDPHRAAPTLFHELMHFLDFTLSGERLPVYLLDGRRLTPADTAELSPEDFARKMYCIETNFITEGGAELYAGKYLSGTVGSYFKDSAFLTGLEYLYGEDFVRKLFFSADSDALFAEMLLEAGFSEEEYVSACETLNWLSRSLIFDEPETYFAPEDILIRLYEHKLGDGWKADWRFIYILKYMDGIELDDYLLSQHAAFLSTVVFTTWDAYYRFEEELLVCAPKGTNLQVLPPVPFFRKGKLLISAYATIEDTDTGTDAAGVLVFEYDFDSGKPLNCEFIDTKAIFEKYFG